MKISQFWKPVWKMDEKDHLKNLILTHLLLQDMRECECQAGYVGNGLQCLEEVVSPVDRCLEDNGGCDPVATCKDLHFHSKTSSLIPVTIVINQ